MHIRMRRSAIVLLVAAGIVGACQPTAAALPRLDDPKEILAEAIRTTAELEFVQLRAEVETSMPELGQPVTVDAAVEIDLRTRDLHGSMDMGELGFGLGGTQEFLIIGSDSYAKFGTEKWFHTTIDPAFDPRAQVPATPAIAVALEALLEDEGLSATLDGMTGCPTGQCYRVLTTISPELIWRGVQGGLVGAELDELPPVDPTIPEVALEVLVDEATRNLVRVSSSGTVQGSSFEVAVTLSGHDVEFQLLRPAPDQIEDDIGGFFEEQILDEVGNEVVPVP